VESVIRFGFVLLLTVVALALSALDLDAQVPQPTQPSSLVATPTPPPSQAAAATVKFKGTGSASFRESYTQNSSGACSVRNVLATEEATDVSWNVVWSKLKPVGGASYTSTAMSFTGQNFRSDSDDCPGAQGFLCASTLTNDENSFPFLKVSKSGKSAFILTINAEDQLRGLNPTNTTCFQSSIFDNAITEGLNQQSITQLRVKLTPAKKSKKKTLKFTNKKTFDCTDPAKSAAFTNNTCSLTTNLTGTLTINGKYDAKIVK
jgi:hypothetical protein